MSRTITFPGELSANSAFGAARATVRCGRSPSGSVAPVGHVDREHGDAALPDRAHRLPERGAEGTGLAGPEERVHDEREGGQFLGRGHTDME